MQNGRFQLRVEISTLVVLVTVFSISMQNGRFQLRVEISTLVVLVTVFSISS